MALRARCRRRRRRRKTPVAERCDAAAAAAVTQPATDSSYSLIIIIIIIRVGTKGGQPAAKRTLYRNSSRVALSSHSSARYRLVRVARATLSRPSLRVCAACSVLRHRPSACELPSVRVCVCARVLSSADTTRYPTTAACVSR